ncbi:MAG: CDP-diacylglycerol--glycerol-3-phosphate 3-phosphatidyltransferase [Micrococcales bacterium]|nr:CDP-diacylglycerol--glycerol-3-phosphate 3-phosphatidyltransferase [Micrococcales bacterium]NBR61056.1 CDP-diacylglycerol--glycerol-3-phosphate 3-phosphatidyltransferase [Actinomycetota bacterium]NBR54887.1 CDP-diacylglycerol--glycerol-3-phosphate 3-phosphatidyltransferase [Micrococcales bacterium]NBT47049.1 CDP-diacylglycerol--glycerol-3-phosphate 3-phosphatidyltransferase [Actinomycetota bacterium]NBY43762.1 CDP-diacylglycerol--glycerol-3-phosphate 3-phosphatidyltransferase [Micrococcales 
MNVANLITSLRIVIAPVYLWALYTYFQAGQDFNWILLLGFIVVAASDGVDGAIARKKGIVTKLGKTLDPIADKVLIGGAFIVLSLIEPELVPWWVTIAILVREIGITVYRLIVIKDKVIPAGASGKSKTIMQCIAIGWFISPWGFQYSQWQFNIGFGLLYGAVFLTWWSALKLIRESR